MGQIPPLWHHEAHEEFVGRLSGMNINELKLIFEYFKKDIVYIISHMTGKNCLDALTSHSILNMELFVQMKKDLGPIIFSDKLLQVIIDAGKESIIEFWKILYDLQDDCSRLQWIACEINYLGGNLMHQILLDRDGHLMTSELKRIQNHHRHHHLLDKIVNISQESNAERRSYYISERYMDLIVTHVCRPYVSHCHCLIDIGIKHEHYLHSKYCIPDCVSPDRLFRWYRPLQSFPHAIMVNGVPGIGKTTLLHRFMCDWANGKFYQRFAFLFFFRFQDLNRLNKVSLEFLILQKYPYLQGHLENILKEPERLLFVFDGLDESAYKVDFKSNQLCHNINQIEGVGIIVVSLVKQALLKGCSILLTSRPDTLAIKDLGVFKRVMEIVGFLPKERQLYFERFFKNKELSDKAFSFVKNNGVLYSFCYLPSFCWTICTVLSMCFKVQPASNDQPVPPLPTTLTQVFVAYTARILSTNSLDNAQNLLTSIGWMAEHGVMNHISRFKRQTLSQFNVDSTSQLLLSILNKNEDPHHGSFSFQCPLMQEFFAALVHYINYSPVKLQKSLKECEYHKNNHSKFFLSFLCGLSDVSTRSTLKPFLGDLSSNAAKHVLIWLKKVSTHVRIVRIGSWNKCCEEGRRRLINNLFNMYEMQSKDLVLECFGPCGHFDFYKIQVTPLDYTVLSFALESCREVIELNLHECNLQSEHMERLSHVLYNIQTLSLSDNDIGDDGVQIICSALTHPECKINKLMLSSTRLTERACSYLGSAISNNQSLRILSLSNNPLEGPHFSDLMTALSSPACQLEELDLLSTNLTNSSCIPLALVIRGNKSLKRLTLSFNDLTGPHFGELIAALSSPTCTVKQLSFQDILLNDDYVPLLVSLSNNKNLEELNLDNNAMSGASISYLKELILRAPSLKDISLCFNHRMSLEDRQALWELEAKKPNLSVTIA